MAQASFPPVPDTPPKVGHGPGESRQAHLVDDPIMGVRVVHEVPVDSASPGQAALTPDEPSIWEATGEADEG